MEEPEYIYGLKENDLRKLIRDVTAGMSYLREKDIIHRDIKPGNILLSDKSDDSCWKLTDFGAARQLQPEQQFQVTLDVFLKTTHFLERILKDHIELI